MAHLPGRHRMELHLNFQQGTMTGEGRDMIGQFLIRGKYKVEDGKCSWTKRYVGKHDVAYQGYNEGKGIWGVWEIPPFHRGGFHIWPAAMGDPMVSLTYVERSESLFVLDQVWGGVPSLRNKFPSTCINVFRW